MENNKNDVEALTFKNKMMENMLLHLNYTTEQINDICSGSIANYGENLSTADKAITFFAIKENSSSNLSYFASGVVENKKFTGIIYGYEDSTNFTNWYVHENVYLPKIDSDGFALDEELAIEMLNATKCKDFCYHCESIIEKFTIPYDESPYYKINEVWMPSFKDNVLSIGACFEPLNYGNRIFENGEAEHYRSFDEFSNKIFDFEKVIKDELSIQVNDKTNNQNCGHALIEKAIYSIKSNLFYAEVINEKIMRQYISLIVDHIQDNDKRLSDYNIAETEVCIDCNEIMLPDDECYCSHNGKALCPSCSFLCEECDKYYIKSEIINSRDFFCCKNCQ